MNQPFLPENGDFFTGFLPILWGNGGLWVARQPVPQDVPARATGPQVQGRAGPGRSRRSETPQDVYDNSRAFTKKHKVCRSIVGRQAAVLGSSLWVRMGAIAVM